MSCNAGENGIHLTLQLYGADCPATIVVMATRPEEWIIHGTLGDIVAKVAADPIERTALIFVGHGLGARDFRESAPYDTACQRRFRGRGE